MLLWINFVRRLPQYYNLDIVPTCPELTFAYSNIAHWSACKHTQHKSSARSHFSARFGIYVERQHIRYWQTRAAQIKRSQPLQCALWCTRTQMRARMSKLRTGMHSTEKSNRTQMRARVSKLKTGM